METVIDAMCDIFKAYSFDRTILFKYKVLEEVRWTLSLELSAKKMHRQRFFLLFRNLGESITKLRKMTP